MGAAGVFAATAALLSTSGSGEASVGELALVDPAAIAPAAAPTAVAAAEVPGGVTASLDRPEAAAVWVESTAARVGIGQVAVAAYANASLRIGVEQPGCNLEWTTLAGIGWVESQHGTLGGNEVLHDGTTREPILGPALDGSEGVGAIRPGADDTAAHGNTDWDHAVGPMQFIGSTWSRWGSDGDGDGVADRGDIDDAAYSAGRYLCGDGYDLATGTGWTAAIFAYNHSDAYVTSVLAAANTYAESSG
ncbi:lytic murein transglycosylase [Mumia zhuanghuii]|uniref:Lytic murein transglycosylase n=1 Tax=Mumia zhuanghuii TaxID=2585211 RepID=A0A5Q6S4W5_9ACTN|nr:lytic murein transglycosylase [Mumia zhuanghuii]